MMIFPPGKRHRHPQIPLRELGSENLPRTEKREAERRKAHLGNSRGLFPDRRKTEAHGNASRRSVTAIF
jgi:hypothetical protein